MAAYPLPYDTAGLEGQVALVTGATSGLGWRFARVLAAAGCRVALCGRRTDRLEELALLIRAEGGDALPVSMDVADPASITTAVALTEEQLGPVQILVNNAGIPDAQYATKMSLTLIDDVIGTNLRGPFILSCEVARRLIASKLGGRIVNISSMGAYHYAGVGAALYSTTKAAVSRMTETLAIEWAKFSINVNAIAPGHFDSEMTRAAIARLGDPTSRMPRNRLGTPELLDSTLLYLCSRSSEAVTGTIIKVDDGQLPR